MFKAVGRIFWIRRFKAGWGIGGRHAIPCDCQLQEPGTEALAPRDHHFSIRVARKPRLQRDAVGGGSVGYQRESENGNGKEGQQRATRRAVSASRVCDGWGAQRQKTRRQIDPSGGSTDCNTGAQATVLCRASSIRPGIGVGAD